MAITYNINNQRSKSSADAGASLARLRGGFDAGARLGKVGHARAVTRKAGKRSASAPEVRMECKCKMGNSTCKGRIGARDDNCENCMAREG
eukprot:6192992-Pleurochrysis_carterae.AAC.1